MIIQWIVIALIILIGLKYLKIENSFQTMKLFILIILIAVIYFSMISIFSSDEVNLDSPRGITNAIYIYYGWIGQTISNIWDIGADTTSLIGNAVKINNSNQDEPRR